MRGASLVLSAAVGATGCSAQGRQAPVSLDPGAECYRLSFSEWSRDSRAKDMAWMMPPTLLALTRQPTSGHAEPGSFRILPDGNPALKGERMPFAYWRPTGPETVEVIWSNGFAGIRMTLRRQGHDLEGSAVTISDTPGTETSGARGEHVECSLLSAKPVA